MTVSLIYVLVKPNASGKAEGGATPNWVGLCQLIQLELGGNRIKLSRDSQRMRVMQMQMRLVCMSVCRCWCLPIYMLALRDMPHLAFNQKQTANKQPPTGTGAERTRPADDAEHIPRHIWGLVRGLSPFVFRLLIGVGVAMDCIQKLFTLVCSALLSLTFGKPRRNHKRNRIWNRNSHCNWNRSPCEQLGCFIYYLCRGKDEGKGKT